MPQGHSHETTELRLLFLSEGLRIEETITYKELMMVRLAAFALYADDALILAQGISHEEVPDLWQKDLTGAIQRWFAVGLSSGLA
jgi:uncharacterized protein YaeQ